MASDACGAAADLIKKDANGSTFLSGNSSDLVGKMQQLINNRNEFQKMSACSLRIIEKWNYENDCIAVEKLLSHTKLKNEL